MKQGKIRVRFAPSPTGFLHIGGLRTALFNWLFARQNNGTFILRIEDTDQQRYLPESVSNIFEALRWCKLNWDEGPDKGGEYGPYLQSQRLSIYSDYAKKLVELDRAYYCFCTQERLAELKEQQSAQKIAPRYDQHCRQLTRSEGEGRVAKAEPYVIRLKLPNDGLIVVNDLIRGRVEFSYRHLDDAVIMKSDGFPTYQLANVVDDHLMKINYVIRGEEWLPSTPKHIFIYQAFDWEIPKFAHLPLILSPHGGKLSKRDGAVSVLEYREQGYLPGALINFIALLGWNPKTEQEFFTSDELLKQFSLEKVNKASPVYNLAKLSHLNGLHIRSLKNRDLLEMCKPYFQAAKWPDYEETKLEQIVGLAKDRMETLADVTQLTEFTVNLPDYDKELLIPKNDTKENTLENLKFSDELIGRVGEEAFTAAKLKELFISEISRAGKKNAEVLWPLRVALSGLKASPDVFDIAETLGKDESSKRVDKAIIKLQNC